MFENMNLVSTEPVEWASDDIRGFFGYSVHINNGVWPDNVGFPAFTHEQMLECKRIQDKLNNLYAADEYAAIAYNRNDDTWIESYDCEVADIINPIVVGGLKLYALGYHTGWPWGLVDDEYEYRVI